MVLSEELAIPPLPGQELMLILLSEVQQPLVMET